MSCFYCWKKNSMKIDDNGTCGVCGKAACAPPPARPDGRFHGDACAVSGCGLFFCLPHMHNHPVGGRSVSSSFPQAALAFATGAVTTTSELEKSDAPPEIVLRDKPESLQSLNDFLNYITPGTT